MCYLDWFGLDGAGCATLSFAIPARFVGAPLNTRAAAFDPTTGSLALANAAEFTVHYSSSSARSDAIGWIARRPAVAIVELANHGANQPTPAAS